MEHFDPKLASRVWQRVQGGQPQRPALTGWILETRQNAAALRQLAATDITKKLAALASSQADCLAGIAQLWNQPLAHTQESAPARERPDLTLQRCIGCAMRRASAYAQLSTDGEFGPIFSELSRQEWLLCRLLLELSGRWHSKTT